LPNEEGGPSQSYLPPAYAGLRHQALDALVAAERILGCKIDLCAFPDEKLALIAMRREFVSAIQAIIAPRILNRRFADLLCSLGRTRRNDPTVGGLLSDGQQIPPGANGILKIASARYEAGQKYPPPAPPPLPTAWPGIS